MVSIQGVGTFDVPTIVNQIMAAEAVPQQKLQQRVTTFNTRIDAYEGIATDLRSIKSTSDTLLAGLGVANLVATSSSANLSGTITSTAAQPGAVYDVDVKSLATPFTATFPDDLTLSDRVARGTVFVWSWSQNQWLTADDPTGGNWTLEEFVSEWNSKNFGITAVLDPVGTRNGQTTFNLKMVASSPSDNFDISNQWFGLEFLGAPTSSFGTLAEIDVNGATFFSNTNTFTNAVPGVQLDVSGVEDNITLRVTPEPTITDLSRTTTDMENLVADLNAALATVAGHMNIDNGVLVGDSSARRVQSAILDGIYGLQLTRASLATIGVEMDRYGQLTFDATVFAAGVAANPQMAASLTAALGSVAENVADEAITTGSGYLLTTIQNRESTVEALATRVERWDDRLALRMEILTERFSALNAALAALENQSSWLTTQLDTLAAMRNGTR